MTLSNTPIYLVRHWQNQLARAKGYRSFELLAMAAITDARAARHFESIQREVRTRRATA